SAARRAALARGWGPAQFLEADQPRPCRDAPMALTPGTRLGSYEITNAIGAGGMGEVYRAHDARLRRDVAVKVLPASVAFDPDRLRRFEQEALATAALNHPNILAVYDVGREGRTAFVVEELLEGDTLRDGLITGA